MHTARIGIFGASGYAGMELTRLVSAHGQLKVSFLASERHVGTSVEQFTGVTGPVGRMSYVGFEDAKKLAAECEAVFLATPAEVSLALTSELLSKNVKVVDLSGAFRLSDLDAYKKYYGHSAPSAELQAKAAYGMPELFRASVKGSSFVANPGCYPTAATL
ncbi:MAG: N-acetyl-gamma-glutamyl-phosphate reductase, partial [Myxococcaceae bacterium]